MIESTLAKISARLLSPMELKAAIQETIADLGLIMQASRVALIQFPASSTKAISEVIEWHALGTLPLPNELERQLNSTYPWFRNQLDGNKTVYIKDLSALPEAAHSLAELLTGREADSLLLLPLIMDFRLAGVIACSNPHLSASKISENIQSGEVVASMLGSLLHREALLNTLEDKMAERTRELSAFFDLAMLSGEAQEISDIMQPALVKIMEINACEAALIHVYEEDQRSLKLVAQRGFPKRYLSQLQRISLDESMMAWIEDVGSGDGFDSSVTPVVPEVFAFPEYHSASRILLRARGRTQGFLSCYWLADVPFNPYQVTFLSAIGEQLGMAVENYRLRLKAEEVATIQERQRVARELHDAVSQTLYSLTLFARSGRDALDVGDQTKLLDSLEQVEMNSLAALKEMRLLLYQLRSLALEEGGLVQAVESRFNLVERRLGIQADINMGPRVELTGQVEQELFRLVTEALNNTLKHAGASRVSVSLQLENDQVVLVVSDNGRGLDPSRVNIGLGLQNMRERASALGGRFEIVSQPGGGTQIRVEIPQLHMQPWEV